MKKKAALLLAILALGVLMAACGQSGTSEPAPTATPTATPTSEPVSSADEQIAEEESTTTGTETHLEDQVNVSQEEADAVYDQMAEDLMKQYMEETGATREEAEAWINEGSAKSEEAAQKREELAELRQQELEAYEAARDEWYRENFGMSLEEWLKLPPAEKAEVVLSHPEVDNSTNPEGSWDWQYQ